MISDIGKPAISQDYHAYDSRVDSKIQLLGWASPKVSQYSYVYCSLYSMLLLILNSLMNSIPNILRERHQPLHFHLLLKLFVLRVWNYTLILQSHQSWPFIMEMPSLTYILRWRIIDEVCRLSTIRHPLNQTYSVQGGSLSPNLKVICQE